RERDASDARRIRLRPTAKGHSLLQKARRRRIADLAGCLAQLAGKERSALASAAEILEQALRRRC
ncbi:MAG: hypothetical protein WA463_19710, partial [Terriglobales bacterium]